MFFWSLNIISYLEFIFLFICHPSIVSQHLLKLDFKWLDLEEKDDRTIGELLSDMQEKATSITDAVAKLQEILGGIDL